MQMIVVVVLTVKTSMVTAHVVQFAVVRIGIIAAVVDIVETSMANVHVVHFVEL